MSFDTDVLRAMLRLARRREPAGAAEVAIRVGGESSKVRAAMRRLGASGLVDLAGETEPRLTMAGLALAVSLLPPGMAKRGESARRASRAA